MVTEGLIEEMPANQQMEAEDGSDEPRCEKETRQISSLLALIHNQSIKSQDMQLRAVQLPSSDWTLGGGVGLHQR